LKFDFKKIQNTLDEHKRWTLSHGWEQFAFFSVLHFLTLHNFYTMGLFAGWCWCWFGLAGAGFL